MLQLPLSQDRFPRLSVLLLLGLLLSLHVPECRAEGRFGDSTWVAPGYPESGDPAAPAAQGPRVAEPDRERTWETVLRTPFRVVFLPLRLLARGMEAGANVAEEWAPAGSFGRSGGASGPGLRFGPAFRYSGAAGPALGVAASARDFAGEGSKFGASATWSLRDNRRAQARLSFGEGVSAFGGGVEGLFDYRPNRRFYGIGNDAPKERTIYLRRDSNVDGFVFFGREPHQRIRGLIGTSGIKIGNGYNGGTAPHAADVFSPAEVPFLQGGSRVWSVGVAGDYAALDRVREPSHGFHLRGDARRVTSLGETDLEYTSWRVEGRGYLPVFASRRVVAMRGVLRGVDPSADTDPVPFYRLPESSDPDKFSAYSSGRFRDRRLALAHLEYRWLIWERLWAVALAQRGVVAASNHAIRYTDMHESYGGGLRYRMSDTRSARLEIAKGEDGVSVYLDLKGDF